VDEVPRRSAQLRLRLAERRTQAVVVHQIRAVRQNQAVRQDLPVLRGHQCPSGCVSDAWAVVRRGTGQAPKVRQESAADSRRGRSKDGDRRLVCRAECQRPVPGFRFRARLAAELELYRQAWDPSEASPCGARAARELPAA
jgi:hypothetical protein